MKFRYKLLIVLVVLGIISSVAAFAPNRRSFDYIGQYNFMVEIEGVTVGAFTSVEGLESITEVIEYLDGDDIILRKRPGITRYSNIVLKRGFINTPELWDWRQAVIDGQIERKSGSIIIADDTAAEIMRFNFFEGWPVRYKLGSFEGEGNDVLIEELEIAVEKIERG